MATPPLASAMARQLVQKLAGGGPQGPSPMGPGAAGALNSNPGAEAGQQVSRQLAELQGADPNAIMGALQQVKGIIVSLYPRTAFSMPGVSRNLAQVQKYIDNAIKEAEQASATAQTVQPPIANSAAIPNPSPMGQGLQDFATQGAA